MMDASEQVRRKSSALRWRQGSINLVLAVILGRAMGPAEPNFLVLGLFTFGVLRLVQGAELRLGLLVHGGWTDIPSTPPVIGCWAAGAVYLQRLMNHGGAGNGWRLALWVAAGVLLYAAGRWLQQRYYANYQRRH